jgi:hypothetical protein
MKQLILFRQSVGFFAGESSYIQKMRIMFLAGFEPASAPTVPNRKICSDWEQRGNSLQSLAAKHSDPVRMYRGVM